ncbi:uncharacterized protein LY89DRAFT_687538 [Mollisia scopiformis]|uniref:Uncharacterized protein n=1 Tax=Mollisia scopiformis TaxID=149040 RepID=A0A194WZQ3_MOLSC|nr:uncharacterized protein LY89DRAFT_687538 [Mollisia scopiformis]KUJ13421.1 hypothetical protein LY89DRAFT_687538 [Mollisia scopiformis]
MYSSIPIFMLALGCAAQARVLASPASNTTSTPSPTASAIVIAGSCDQNTLQYCCPLVQPQAGEGSVDFATDCRQGNLPASYDCFYAFEDICCQGSPDENGNTCEIVPPAGDICAPGAAGTIQSLGAVVGASTVTETVDCATASSTSSAASTTATTTVVSNSAPATTSPAMMRRRG